MITYLLILNIIFILIGIILYLWQECTTKNNHYEMKPMKKNPKFTILIPARDESFVIEDLLKSIENQTRKINTQDIYVIVEKKEDPTIKICKKYKVSVIIRKHLDKKSKGYALAEAIEYLKKQEKWYDAYFIFDADNILDPNYLKEMEQDYLKGYVISSGYRNLKNGNDSIIAAASGLTYLFLNEWINKKSQKKKKNINVSGTGFYIRGDLIKKWGTYPFHSLTEDMELNYYACLNNLSSNYNEKAIFYDEQPLTLKESITQRKRWIKGYFKNWFSNIKKLHQKRKTTSHNKGSLKSMEFGILPAIFIVFGTLFFLIIALIYLIKLCFHHQAYIWILSLDYLLLVWITEFMIRSQKEKLNLSKEMKKKVIWYHPIFLITYIYVVILVIINPNIKWDPIVHGRKNNKK